MKYNYRTTKMLLVAALGVFSLEATAQTTFNYTGSVQTYTVSAGVTNLCIDAYGASGGVTHNGSAVDSGGKGARVQCNLAVTPGQVLNIYVGGAGGDGSFSVYAAAGYNGGGGARYYVGSGGGGATDIRIGGYTVADRVVVAGGGGGGGSERVPITGYERGGDGGGTTAENGYNSNSSTSTAAGGGGTPTAGGTAGTMAGMGSGGAGSLGYGGDGNSMSYGGAGGGGYYGGGGGVYSGGGGGSSYTNPILSAYATHTRGANRGNGRVVISTGCLSAIDGITTLCVGDSITLTNDFSGGLWSSIPGVASVGTSSGVVTGLSAGVSTISYTDGTHLVTMTVTVSPTPGPITGSSSVCIGDTITLAGSISGGTWSSSSPLQAYADSTTGIVMGITAGTATITYSAGGCTATRTLSVVSCSTAGLPGVINGAPVSIFPNPATENISVSADPTVYQTLRITNCLGQMVLQTAIQKNETSISVAKLPAGMYYVQVTGVSGSVLHKLLIQ